MRKKLPESEISDAGFGPWLKTFLNGERSALPSFAPKIRVDVYVPIPMRPAYQDALTWLIEEFTELRGGCTVNENVGGYYLSQNNEVIDDRVSVVYSDSRRIRFRTLRSKSPAILYRFI